jgi:molybdate transport system substrate-binding protein
MSSRSSRGLLAALALAALGSMHAACNRDAPATSSTIRVAAAADLAIALREVAADYEKKTGTKVVSTFGSTGMLAKQIAEGAQYDVFFAANVSFVDDVIEAQACDAATKAPYARGRIVAWSKDSVPAKLEDLADARYVKIAIANPEHAPYGRAAQQALEKLGVWESVKPKLVFGENVRQTLQYAQTGNVEAAIVAISLAIATDGGKYLLVDEALHEPIDQALVVCSRGGNANGGKAFAGFVNGEGRATMRRFGFVLPGEPAVATP